MAELTREEMILLLDEQSKRDGKRHDAMIEKVSATFRKEIQESNEELKKELIALMDMKITQKMAAQPSSGAAGSGNDEKVMKELSSLKEKIAQFENMSAKSNASTAPSQRGWNRDTSSNHAKRARSEEPSRAETNDAEDEEMKDADKPNGIKYRAKDSSVLIFSGKDALRKVEAVKAITKEVEKQEIKYEDIKIKGPAIGNTFVVKFEEKIAHHITGKGAAEAVKHQYRKDNGESEDISIRRGDGADVSYSFGWDKSSTQTLKESVLQVLWKEVRDASKPDDMNGGFEKFKGDGKIMYKYDLVVKINVGVDGRYRLTWGNTQPLERIGKARYALEALIAGRFSSFSG